MSTSPSRSPELSHHHRLQLSPEHSTSPDANNNKDTTTTTTSPLPIRSPFSPCSNSPSQSSVVLGSQVLLSSGIKNARGGDNNPTNNYCSPPSSPSSRKQQHQQRQNIRRSGSSSTTRAWGGGGGGDGNYRRDRSTTPPQNRNRKSPSVGAFRGYSPSGANNNTPLNDRPSSPSSFHNTIGGNAHQFPPYSPHQRSHSPQMAVSVSQSRAEDEEEELQVPAVVSPYDAIRQLEALEALTTAESTESEDDLVRRSCTVAPSQLQHPPTGGSSSPSHHHAERGSIQIGRASSLMASSPAATHNDVNNSSCLHAEKDEPSGEGGVTETTASLLSSVLHPTAVAGFSPSSAPQGDGAIPTPQQAAAEANNNSFISSSASCSSSSNLEYPTGERHICEAYRKDPSRYVAPADSSYEMQVLSDAMTSALEMGLALEWDTQAEAREIQQLPDVAFGRGGNGDDGFVLCDYGVFLDDE